MNPGFESIFGVHFVFGNCIVVQWNQNKAPVDGESSRLEFESRFDSKDFYYSRYDRCWTLEVP